MGVGPQEQVAYCFSQTVGQPALAQMLHLVVENMAALAERLEVLRIVVTRVVIEVRAGQIHTGGLNHCVGGQAFQRRQFERTSLTVAPGLRSLIPPAAIAQVNDQLAVRPAASLAAASGPPEADHVGQLRPVDRVEKAVLRADRHGG